MIDPSYDLIIYMYMSYASYMLDPKLDPYLYASLWSEFMQVHLIRSSLHLYVNVIIIHVLELDMSWLCHMLVYNWCLCQITWYM